jgi:GNAT superfamily N-acetyltransferase
MKNESGGCRAAIKNEVRGEALTDYSLTIAEPPDAADIYALTAEAFGTRYIQYTIFQAPQSVHYLHELIAGGLSGNGHIIYVMRNADGIFAYYDAVLADKEMFLNYIAVTDRYKKRGYGSILLNHYEDLGRQHGCSRLSLDLFESNAVACEWYRKSGYATQAESYQAQVLLRKDVKEGLGLHCRIEDLEYALSQEKARGFSKLDCQYRSGRITLGLINFRSCKLLYRENISIEDAIAAVGNRFGNEREDMIIPNLNSIPVSLANFAFEKVLRLQKEI